MLRLTVVFSFFAQSGAQNLPMFMEKRAGIASNSTSFMQPPEGDPFAGLAGLHTPFAVGPSVCVHNTAKLQHKDRGQDHKEHARQAGHLSGLQQFHEKAKVAPLVASAAE